MRRREFLKKGTVAVGLASSPKLLPPLTANEGGPQEPSQISGPKGAAREEIRSADYLRRVRAEKYVTKPPAFAESKLTPAVRISPMSLAERLKRNIVPKTRLLQYRARQDDQRGYSPPAMER